MNKAERTWETYKDLSAPEPRELTGKWRIHMDAWWGFLFRNIKVIEYSHTEYFPDLVSKTKQLFKGHNVAFGFRRWGEFCIEEECILHYNNGKIVDRLVRVAKDRLKGLFILDDEPKYTFTMERIDVLQGEERQGA